MAAKSIALILGAGPRIGTSVAEKFAAIGYQIAIASRKGDGKKNAQGYLALKADFAQPDSIQAVFDAVKAEYNAPPSVVIYNAATLTNPPEQDNVLSIPTSSVTADLNVNVVSAYTAAQLAVRGWESLPKDTKKSFIYTGNILNTVVLPAPMMVTLGMGKASSAYWIGVADQQFKDKGYRFFYADERYEDGKLKGMQIDGPAHADFYAQLAAHEGQIPWHATFAKGKSYAKF
ncbi:NAD(P)-binding protein [Xylariaceae sp. FL0016]|nr:NAD(P)-binding protein [Xylariaceae sp. FL0016]